MHSPSRRSGSPIHLTPRQAALVVGVLVLLAAYACFRPALSRRFGVELPSLTSPPNPTPTSSDFGRETTATVPPTNSGPGGFALKRLSGDRFETPAGLIYGPSSGGHRIDHVMLHARDDPDRPQQHGVFDVQTRDEVLGLIDQAYELVRNKSPQVDTRREDDRIVHTIDLRRRIGYVGGQSGRRQDYPTCRKITLVLAGRNVITAYPVK